MESAPLKNTPDLQALRDEYAHLAFELRRGPMEPATHAQITQEAKGWKAKLAAVMEGIGSMFRHEDDQEKEQQLRAEIATAEKILAFSQKPEFAEALKDSKRHIELMLHAQRRIKIFTQEQQAAEREMSQGASSYSPSSALKAHRKLVQAAQEVADNTKLFNDLAKVLLAKLQDVLKVPQS